MDSILVTGNGPLQGQIPIAGAKNACLTLMPATLLSEEPLTLTNAPRLSDIKTMTQLLQSLGAEVSALQDGQVQAMSSHNLDNHVADYDIVRKMRASNLVLGPMLARLGQAVVSLPGGCAIGARPMDLHIHGLEALGAEAKHVRRGDVHIVAARIIEGAAIEGTDLRPKGFNVHHAFGLSDTVRFRGQVERALCRLESLAASGLGVGAGASGISR